MKKAIIGTWPLSGDFGYVSLEQVAATLGACWDQGFREYDTAPSYGNGFAEFCLGKAFHGKPDVLFNTKCGNRPFGGKSFEISYLRESVENSLKRLNVEALNILFLHNPRTEIADYEPYLDFMSALKKEGKIRFSGISLAKGYAYPDNVMEKFDVVQDDINLLHMDPLFRSYAGKTKIMARSPLASGLLGGHLHAKATFPADDQRAGWLKGERLASILKRISAIENISSLPIDQLARRFLMSQKAITNVIFGVKRPEHVAALVQDINSKLLEPGLIEELVNLYKNDFGLTGEKHLSY